MEKYNLIEESNYLNLAVAQVQALIALANEMAELNKILDKKGVKVRK